MRMTMTNTDIISVKPTPPAATPTRLDALEKYARSGGGGLYGDLLKFSGKTGAWTAGAQGVEISIGTQLVAIVPEMLVGFVQWKDGELVDQAMQPLTEVYDPRALRASLGDTNRERWVKNDEGQLEDPWREAALLPLKNLKTGAEYTYSTSSLGGVRCVKQLVATYAWQIRTAPETTIGHLPLVELGVRSYKHSDRKRGTIYNPVLTGVDWVPASVVVEEAKSFEDHRDHRDKKKARKASL
jgi:hypothetical protein